MAFKKGEPIGQIVGRVIAPGTNQDNGLTLGFIRDDIDGKPSIGEIYTGAECNIFRFMDHRYKDPSALLQGSAIFGGFRVLVYAKRDILDRQELSVGLGSS